MVVSMTAIIIHLNITEDDDMNKFFLKSKTVWGVILMLLPVLPAIGAAVGFTVGTEDTALITEAGDALLQSIGAVLTLYGRHKAGGLSVSDS